ncbi:hypothetical protein CB1_000299004 [Camelus ferus]|nr:hypothetical protein CB1_000299004 [Camelus ferus]
MNDSLVHSSNIKVVLNQQAYVLFYLRLPGSKKRPEGSISRTACSVPGRPGVVPDHVRKSIANGAASSPLAGKRPDPVTMKKLQTPEEVGVPIARNGSLLGLKSQNGHAPPKLPSGSPSSKLSKTPTHAPTLLEEPGKKVNGGIRAPPHQLLEASEPPQILRKKRKKSPVGETRGSEVGTATAAPPGKRRRRKRRQTGDTDASPRQEGQVQRQPWGPECRMESRVGLPVDRLEEESGQQQENSQHLGNGWLEGCVTDGHPVSNRKKRRRGAESLGGEDCLPQDPPWHGHCMKVKSPAGKCCLWRHPEQLIPGVREQGVLTWDGEVSAVSQDAMQDSRLARTATVIDNWDEEFDRGKEKKVKKFKREKKRSFNAFQKLQSRRNFWSVTHPAKATSLSYRR